MAGFSRRGTQLITGAVTVNVLIDWLDGFEVLLRPEETTRTISWIIAPHDAKLADPFPENEMLFLLHIEDVEKTLASKPLSAGLLVLRKNEPFSVRRLPFDMAFLRRLIVIRAPMDIEDVADLELLSMLQLRFFEMYQWTRELQGVIDRKGSQQDLIDATENVLGNYLDVNDSTYSLIAFTKHIEAADMLSKELQTLGCHPKFRIDYLEQKNILEAWREQKAVEVFAPDEICSVPYMTKIMRQEGEYRGHVVMVCNNVKPSAGLIDLFSFFAAYCEKLDAILSDHCAQHPQPVIDFLTRVLTSNRLSQEYIGNQLLILGMDDDCEYRVVVLDAQTSRHSDNVALLISEFSAAIPHAIAFFHENRIVVLFHGTKFDREIALRDRNSVIAFCNRFGCIAFESDRFHEIRNLPYAYRQAIYAQKYSPFIDIELRPLDNIDQRRLFTFEEAFCYYCFENDINDEFGSFCLNHTILDEMIQDSSHSDVSDVVVLYYYLFNERKATPTANQLHMHRNNVLYRIANIEKKYGFDLNQYGTRQRLLHCYRIKLVKSWQFRTMMTL